MSTHLSQLDEWAFLPADDEPAINEQRAVEIVALHLEVWTSTPATDPARADVDTPWTANDSRSTFDYFDDEQPEVGRRNVVADDDDYQTDLQGLLERQHYAFAG